MNHHRPTTSLGTVVESADEQIQGDVCPQLIDGAGLLQKDLEGKRLPCLVRISAIASAVRQPKETSHV
jgi:hypothetical protein